MPKTTTKPKRRKKRRVVSKASLKRQLGEETRLRRLADVAAERALLTARKASAAVDAVIHERLRIAISKTSMQSLVSARYRAPDVRFFADDRKRPSPWERSPEPIAEQIKELRGYQLGMQTTLNEAYITNRHDVAGYLEMLAEQIGNSIARAVLDAMLKEGYDT